jgi:phosphoribosylglycinamide formyltransferase-1
MSYKIIVMGSGRGSNAKAILEAERQGSLGSVEVAAILSDVPNAPILDLASDYEKPKHCVPNEKGKAKLNPKESAEFLKIIQSYSPKLIVLAGFMRILDKAFIDALGGQIINLHPSLLPSFPGIHSIKQAYDYPVKITGCTVHWVTPELDAGPIIDQASVQIEAEDTLESLSQKVHQTEHLLLPKVIRALSETA